MRTLAKEQQPLATDRAQSSIRGPFDWLTAARLRIAAEMP